MVLLRAHDFFAFARLACWHQRSRSDVRVRVLCCGRSLDRLLMEADNVDLGLLVDRKKLREADIAKNRELERNKLSFDPPKGSLIRPGTRLGEVSIPELTPSFGAPLDPYEFIYADVRPVFSS